MKHIVVNDELWRKLNILKVFLGKPSLQKMIEDILIEWADTKGIIFDIDKEKSVHVQTIVKPYLKN